MQYLPYSYLTRASGFPQDKRVLNIQKAFYKHFLGILVMFTFPFEEGNIEFLGIFSPCFGMRFLLRMYWRLQL